MGLHSHGACLLFCFYFIKIQGSTSQPRFIQTNSDLHLTVTEFQTGDLFIWKFNNSINIIRLLREEIKKTDEYKDRVDFFPHNLSLVLKNVQLSDSGIYTAEVLRDKNVILATHDVTVQAPVSPVNLSLVSGFNSSESCNFTVCCTTESSSVNASFTCDRHTCEEPRPLTSDSAFSLSLYLSDVSIICNHSNHVSWKNDTKEIKQVCPVFGSKNPPEETAKYLIPVVCVIVGILLVLLILAAVLCRRRQKSQRMEVENTIYSTPDRPFPKPVPASEPLLEDPTSTYSLVGPHSAPVPQSSDTLYSTVNKPESNSHSQSQPLQS